jgi:hypothetical protein
LRNDAKKETIETSALIAPVPLSEDGDGVFSIFTQDTDLRSYQQQKAKQTSGIPRWLLSCLVTLLAKNHCMRFLRQLFREVVQ